MAHPFSPRSEVAPMILSVWGEALAPAVAAMIVGRPSLGHRLALAPRRIVHVLAAYISDALARELEPAAIAAEIEARDARDLLGHAVLNPHPRLFGLLDRAGSCALPLGFYLQLNAVLHGAASSLVLSSEVALDAAYLSIVEVIAADAVLSAAHKAIGASRSDLHLLLSAVAFVRASGLGRDIEELPPGSGWRAIRRRLASDLGRAVAPVPSFRAPDGWRKVEDMASLWAVGKRMGNCVSGIGGGGEDHLFAFVAGSQVFYAAGDETPSLAAIQNVGPQLWAISQISVPSGHRGHAIGWENFAVELRLALAEIGHALLDTSPSSAFRSIAWRDRSNGLAAGEDDDDADEIDEAA